MKSKKEIKPRDVERHFNKLREQPLRRFPDSSRELAAPSELGVYIIYSPTGKVVHVGRTSSARKGIAQRLRNHRNGNSSFTKKYLEGDGSKLKRGYKFRCLIVEDDRLRAYLEAYAIGRLCPAHIGTG